MRRSVDPSQRSQTTLATVLWGAAALLCVVGFYDVGELYGGLKIPYGLGVQEIHGAELIVWIWLLLFGVPAVFFLARALERTPLPDRVLRDLGGAWTGRRGWLVAGAGLVFFACLAVRHFALRDAPIADDESTYAFIAQTLLQGRFVNPSPGDVPFFENQFVVVDQSSWYGKYPIGHPLALAFGELLGLRVLVVPLISAASFGLAFAVGRRIFPEREALLGTALLLVSPQFLFTGATQLSQPTAGLCLLAGLWGLMRLAEDGRSRWAWLSGAAWGAGILVRPLPGVLFLAVAGLWFVFAFRHEPLVRRLRWLAIGAAPVVACVAVLGAVHWAQTGNPVRSGYQAVHATGFGFFRREFIAASIGASVLRQNFWLFGWPLSFAFLPLARRGGRTGLLWGMVAAEYAYRVILPKTVVASTGPVYVAEIVPLLALASGSGMMCAVERLRALGVECAPRRVAGATLAAIAVGALTFLPIQLRELSRSGLAWQTVNRLLADAGAGRALVFADRMVHLPNGDSWAYFPPNPSPRLDDPTLFVRIPKGADGQRRALEFWRRRFPDRSVWLFAFEEGEPALHRLTPPNRLSRPGEAVRRGARDGSDPGSPG